MSTAAAVKSIAKSAFQAMYYSELNQGSIHWDYPRDTVTYKFSDGSQIAVRRGQITATDSNENRKS